MQELNETQAATDHSKMIKNRIGKNWKKIKKQTTKNNWEAVRIYDRDIPEYPYIIEKYKDHFVVWEKGKDNYDYRERNQFVHQALNNIFEISDPQKIIFKKRQKQKGVDQYERLDATNDSLIIQEGSFSFKINIKDFLDTGLYLNHRPLRSMIHNLSSTKSFLNLFSYTSSMSVAAALGGAKTTSVDLSNTYLNWSQDNFKLNGIPLDAEQHSFVRETVPLYLKKAKDRGDSFDLIYCDPPTFSNSKKMDSSFDVQEDHTSLIDGCMSLLNEGDQNALYFSCHKKGFKIDINSLQEKYKIEDITASSVPTDFRNKKIHFLFKIQHR
ncbi:MAG: class I SAM-dependent methyltransferase [Bdellovibrionota bacterium]|nr:class I SAM-dependent methyltransferase [Bdellovibrionota bacterium]